LIINNHPFFNNRDAVLSFQKPGRYTGGEWGSIPRNQNKFFKIALCFPDLYEIGMSNQAIRILYDLWNKMPDVQCERFFTPFTDMESWLRSNHEPLTSLESGIPLKDFDVIAFTFGYELSMTNMFNMLELAGVPVFKDDRTGNDPLIICGGPASTNPLPYSRFIDAVFIGEAESVLETMTNEWISYKQAGLSRESVLEKIALDPNFWMSGKKNPTQKALWMDFPVVKKNPDYYPIPNIEVVQGHGVIEIMRGCPNKCRFCHAGYYYRPMREKDLEQIINEADFLVHKCGFREITLSSLSSGDFQNLTSVVKMLHARYSHLKVSFAVPSLRVDSLTLPLIAELSSVRKSGLTFAVETPLDEWQKIINKPVPMDKIITILNEAKANGWKMAKFYFMIGLPGQEAESVASGISQYLLTIQRETGLQLNTNINIFIPKVHTPFQYEEQLDEAVGFSIIRDIKQLISHNKKIKIGYQSSYLSVLEGLVARGGEWVGLMFYESFLKGARFDAWSDLCRMDIWKDFLTSHQDEIKKQLNGKDNNEWESSPAWAGITLGAHPNYLKKEYHRSLNHELNNACELPCSDFCGVCSDGISIVRNEMTIDNLKEQNNSFVRDDMIIIKYLFKYTKRDAAIAIGHLDLLNVIEKAFQRSGAVFKYSDGYNPIPQFEFSAPLPVGFVSNGEIGSIELLVNRSEDPITHIEHIKHKLNNTLPEGLNFTEFTVADDFWKTKRLMGEYWGGAYIISFNPEKRSIEKYKASFEELLLAKKAEKNYDIQWDRNLLHIIIQEFNTPVGLQKILKAISGDEVHFLHGIEVTRNEMFKRDKDGKSIYL
jgi:radical SAM-linked protein